MPPWPFRAGGYVVRSRGTRARQSPKDGASEPPSGAARPSGAGRPQWCFPSLHDEAHNHKIIFRPKSILISKRSWVGLRLYRRELRHALLQPETGGSIVKMKTKMTEQTKTPAKSAKF